MWYPAGTFLFKVNNENTRTLYKTCSKLSIMAPERLCWCRSRVFIVNFKDILYLFLVFLLLFSTVICLLDFWFLNRFQFFDFSPFIAEKLRFNFFQKQLFARVLQNRCYEEFRNIDRKAPVLESHFNKISDLKARIFTKKRLQHRCFPVNTAKFSRTAFLCRTPLVTASVSRDWTVFRSCGLHVFRKKVFLSLQLY